MRVAVVDFLVLSDHTHRDTGRVNLRTFVGHNRPIQRLLQGLCRRAKGFSQGHAAATGVGAEHGQGQAAVLKLSSFYFFTDAAFGDDYFILCLT